MEECEYCTILEYGGEGQACGDMWLVKSMLGWRLFSTMGESEVFYCPWCGRDLSEDTLPKADTFGEDK